MTQKCADCKRDFRYLTIVVNDREMCFECFEKMDEQRWVKAKNNNKLLQSIDKQKVPAPSKTANEMILIDRETLGRAYDKIDEFYFRLVGENCPHQAELLIPLLKKLEGKLK